MSIVTVCAGCAKQLVVDKAHVGKKARCPSCGQIYTVPLQSTDPYSSATNPAPESGEPLGDTACTTLPHPTAPVKDQSTQFWMRATDGNLYGPATQDELNRWFLEGRVGTGYLIRMGENGAWQDAALHLPRNISPAGVSGASSAAAPAMANPYAVPGQPAGQGYSAASGRAYPQSDQSVVVLVMAILGFVICPMFSTIAVYMGHNALRDIAAGLADPNGKTLVQAGFWIGIANLALFGLGILLLIVIMLLSAGLR